MSLSRRQLLLSSFALTVAPQAVRAGDVKMITLSPQPVDLETPVEGLVDEITPVQNFFVRSHTYIPEVKIEDWKLTIDGLVEKTLTLTLDELKKMPRTEMACVLECAGNGRSFHRPRVAGAQWQFGSVGCARWTGVRLKDVLAKAGVKPGAAEMLLDGADVPLDKMPDFQRTLTAEKALHEDTLLAYAMNGEPLTPQHGFPLRLIAPGWAGNSWVKWLQRITVLDHEFDGFWMKTAYRHPKGPVAPGTAVDPKDMIPVTDLNVKSVIAHPGEWSKPGLVQVVGVAWSNSNPVTRVEISTDGGKTWTNTKLLGKGTQYGFRKWSFRWQAAEGQYTLISRATNSKGETQPMEPQWNPSGYLYNAAQPRPILVSATQPAPMPEPEPEKRTPPPGYTASCMGCHDERMMQQQRLTRQQWDREVTKMTNWGAPVQPENRDALLDYLSSHFKP